MTYNNDPKQTMWETWFVSSVIILMATLFVGTLEGSRIIFPNWDIFAIVVFINFCVSLGYGMKKR